VEKDVYYSSFHAIGKILYAKREWPMPHPSHDCPMLWPSSFPGSRYPRVVHVQVKVARAPARVMVVRRWALCLRRCWSTVTWKSTPSPPSCR
jgi:hypothetical protein